MGARKKGYEYDWQKIQAFYETGTHSFADLARRFGVSEQHLRRKVKAEGWVMGGTAERVAMRAEADLIRRPGEKIVTDEAIREAAQTMVEVVREHRGVIHRGRRITMKLLEQLQDAVENKAELIEEVIKDTAADHAPTRRQRMLKAIELPAHSGVMRELSMAAKTWIELERQAFNMDGQRKLDEPTDLTDEQLDNRLADALRKAGIAPAAGGAQPQSIAQPDGDVLPGDGAASA